MDPFTIDNLPYGVISTANNTNKRCAIAFGDSAIDVEQLYQEGFFSSVPELRNDVFHDNWNAFSVLSRDIRSAFRARIKSGILDGSVDKAMIPLSTAQCHLPMMTHNFSDFYCSYEHANNCSKVMGFRGISPNWFSIPSVYNGRTSSLVVSGTPVTRPCGMYPDPKEKIITFRPESRLDFELEVAVWVSNPIPRGLRLDIADATDHVFGFSLLNDWSARDIQLFEMPPLGPFHSKGFATTVSSWIVPIEALEQVLCDRKTKQDPAPAPHLMHIMDTTFNIELSVTLLRNGKSYNICESNLNELYWSPIQQLTHLASAGESIAPGDVFGTGTISSNRTSLDGEKIGLGCLFERTLPGAKLKSMPPDLIDTFLKDGDEIVMEGWCRDQSGRVILGFGECKGKVLPHR